MGHGETSVAEVTRRTGAFVEEGHLKAGVGGKDPWMTAVVWPPRTTRS